MKNSEWERDFAQSIILIIDDNKNNLGVVIGYLKMFRKIVTHLCATHFESASHIRVI